MKTPLALLFFLMLFAGYAQQQQEKPKPEFKVGLVLSGGGAKGLAHIGVLKTLDSLGVKVDYVAGTSMGAIIGSLYASGYSGAQLDSIFNGVDFDKLIGDDLPRESKTFYERENSEKYAITLPFDDFKIQLPSAISRGQNVFNLLTKLTLHVSDVEAFDQLPIPFFCVATNIETGEQIMLDRGSLPQAISASGAFPSLFQPVVIDGQILMDGGITNNYPVEELKAKGMDIIIGVDVQDGLADREELQSATEILLQINNFRTINAMKEKSKQTDIYIQPDINDFNVVSFNEGAQIIEKGREAAVEMSAVLKELARLQGNISQERPYIKPMDSIKIKSVLIEGNEKYTRSYILGKLKIKQGQTLSYEDFNKGVNNLVGTNNFDSFLYTFKPDGDGYSLMARFKESKNTTALKVGVHYDDLYKSAALLNITRKRLLLDNDVIALDVILGDNIRYNFQYYIDKGYYWSIGLSSRYNTFHRNVSPSLLPDDNDIQTLGLNKIDVEVNDITNQFFVQTLFTQDLSLILGAEHKRLKISSETILDGTDDEEETVFEKSDFFSVFGQLKLDTYDNKFFPKKGVLFDGDFHLFLSSSDFNNDFSQFSYAKAKIGYAFSLTDKFSVNIGSEGGFKLGDDSNSSLNFCVGGIRTKPDK